jgi:iron complex transport system substrate-binding protein
VILRFPPPILVSVLLALLATGPIRAGEPRRVMSINLCSDQLLLDLLPPERITSVTYLSRARNQSYLSAAAWQVGVNYGNAEEVVSERPDLVIAGTYTTPDTRALLKEVGIPVLELPPADSFEEIRDVTRAVGRAVGAEARAESLIRRMDDTLAQLAATAPRRPISIVGWDGARTVPGKGTLFNAIVEAAGAVNLGATAWGHHLRFDAEMLLVANPDLLAFGDATIAAPALHNMPLSLPLVNRVYAGREILYPELLYSCGLPQTADAAVQIRQMMLAVRKGGPRT